MDYVLVGGVDLVHTKTLNNIMVLNGQQVVRWVQGKRTFQDVEL